MNKEKAEQIYKVLADLAVDWKDQDNILKKAVDLFIDIYPVMLNQSDYYTLPNTLLSYSVPGYFKLQVILFHDKIDS